MYWYLDGGIVYRRYCYGGVMRTFREWLCGRAGANQRPDPDCRDQSKPDWHSKGDSQRWTDQHHFSGCEAGCGLFVSALVSPASHLFSVPVPSRLTLTMHGLSNHCLHTPMSAAQAVLLSSSMHPGPGFSKEIAANIWRPKILPDALPPYPQGIFCLGSAVPCRSLENSFCNPLPIAEEPYLICCFANWNPCLLPILHGLMNSWTHTASCPSSASHLSALYNVLHPSRSSTDYSPRTHSNRLKLSTFLCSFMPRTFL